MVIFTVAFIYFSGGAIYTHISLIISLIVLSFYGNWRILLPYSTIMLLYYILSIYQITTGKNWEQFFMSSEFTSQEHFIVIISSIGLITFSLMVFLCQYIDQLNRNNENKVLLDFKMDEIIFSRY